MKTNNIPHEVAWVLCAQMGQLPLGRDGYEKAQSIIEKYPEHFPWEHKYKSIPSGNIIVFWDQLYIAHIQ